MISVPGSLTRLSLGGRLTRISIFRYAVFADILCHVNDTAIAA